MQIKHFFGNSMTLPRPIIPDNSLKEVYCLECGELDKIEINNWIDAECYICDKCKSENEKT